MSKWNKKLVKILTAASLAASLAFCAPCTPLGAYAATSVTDGVMIRNDATTEAGIIGSLNEGDEVTILDVLQSGDGYAWYYIQLGNGNKGFVRSDLISADDSELAEFQTEPEEEQKEEEAPAEPAEEEAEPQEAEPAQEAPAEAATTAAAETTSAVTTAEGYDAYKDPAANIVARFETDENGEGSWYVFNDDNGSKIKVSDLRDAQAAPASSGTPGFWRPLAIVFGILALAFAALALYLIKSIRDSRTKSSRRRALEEAKAEEEDEEEFYFEDDEPDYEDEIDDAPEEEAPQADRAMTDSTIEAGQPQEAEVTDIPAGEIEAAIAASTAQIEKSIHEEQAPAAAEAVEEAAPVADDLPENQEKAYAVVNEENTAETVDDAAVVSDAAVVADPAAASEEQPAQAAMDDQEEPVYSTAPISAQEEASDADYKEAEAEEDYYEDDADVDENDDYIDEEDEYEDDDYDDEDDDEDYDDEDYEDEDYDDDEEEDRRPRSKGGKNGGLFGFLSKIFGTTSHEDEDEGDNFDEEDEEAPVREFDEFKEYPEDIDLLPRDDYDDKEDLEEEEDLEIYDEEGNGARDRLTMQKVMKNVDYREVETDFDDEDMDGLFDDDDDMEYSFISSTRRK